MSEPHFLTDVPLRDYSTFKIGGNARYFAKAHTTEELAACVKHCRLASLPYFILGKGSNCLFDDRGFDGVVILNKIAFCNFDGPQVHVGAGYSFSLLGTQTARKGYSGLEFASGIPGTVGGAVYMNAGANGRECADALCDVIFVTEEGHIETHKKCDLTFSYRFSSYQQKKGAIAAATFTLTPLDTARQRQMEIVDYRMRTQPYSDPSVGCVFRNPSKQSAGALIEQSGLKGKTIGGAAVSAVHANFIVNQGMATAEDVRALAQYIQHVVKEKTGVELEMEMRCIPHTLDT